MKPRIAIPTPHTRADYSARALPQYREAVEAAGGEAVEISIAAEPSEIAQLIKTCDAILLPGSPADVDPQKYGAERDPKTADADPARDDADELLLQDAHNMRKPILGICYGLQSLNVWRSGTLKQHLETGVQHSRPKGMASGESPEHAAVVESASHMANIVERALEGEFGKSHICEKRADVGHQIIVNSSHHQSVEQSGDGLRVVARSARDGVVEAVESTAPDHFVLGVQWHPERMWQQDATSREMFRTLVEEAKKWHEQRAAEIRDFETLKRN